MTLDSVACVNCGAEVNGNFCSKCGQRVNVKRLSFREGWNDFWARVYGFDGMFPRTLRDLTIKPGKAALRFIERNRVLYYGPVGYFFLMITLLYLVASLLGIDMVDFVKNSTDTGLQQSAKPGSGQDKFMQDSMKMMADNIKLASFIVVPLQAFYARYVFFRKSNLTFIEQTVLPFYTMGHIYWLSMMSLICYASFGKFISNWLQIALNVYYVGFAYANMFTYQSKIKAFFKGLGIYLMAQITLSILVAVIVILVLYFNPDMR